MSFSSFQSTAFYLFAFLFNAYKHILLHVKKKLGGWGVLLS